MKTVIFNTTFVCSSHVRYIQALLTNGTTTML